MKTWIAVIAALVASGGCEKAGGSGSSSNRRGSGSGSGSGSGDGSSVTGLIETRANLDLSAMRHRLDNVQTTCAAAKLDCPIEALARSKPIADAAPCADAFVQIRTRQPMVLDTCDVAFQWGTQVMIARDVMICPKDKVTLAAARCDGDALVAELARPDRKDRVNVGCTMRGQPSCARGSLTVSDDDAIATFVAEVVALANTHAWDELIARTARAHQDSQLVVMKQDKATYVAELFTLNSEFNRIVEGDADITIADMDQITNLEIADVVADEGAPAALYLGFGRASLADGTTLHVEIMITREHDTLVLTGPSG
jgi:hypothetical protein